MAGLIVPASPAARSDTTYSVLATGFAALALPGILADTTRLAERAPHSGWYLRR